MKVLSQMTTLFHQLDEFIIVYNRDRLEDGGLSLPRQTLKIVGQFALLLSNLPFEVTATSDLDHVGEIDHAVKKELARLLLEKNIHLETDTHLIWIPKNTSYTKFYDGLALVVLLAEPSAVLKAKQKFNRPKDARVVTNLKKYLNQK
jgi:hypothetical protein